MKVITCYSYKGGVGRTLTAANFAIYLAKLGFKVVAVDFDFEAPGLDSKFGDIRLKEGQRGMLDLVLEYQLSGAVPDTLTDYAISVRSNADSESSGSLHLIPAGDYLAAEYPSKLNKLHWDHVFAAERAGIAFLEAILSLINRDFGADYVIVDSRTGISETAGVCTQVLADEVLMFSSLAVESVKMTSHLARVIRESQVAKSMGKQIDVKVVVTRVPQPRDIEAFRKKWRATFAVPEERFFVLFSSPQLESSEYLAITAPTRNGNLTANYIELFQSLKLDLAKNRIKEQIEQTTKTLLLQPERAETTVRGLVALYPSVDSYRTAMRFFIVAQQPGEVRRFAWLILEIEPDDNEAHKLLAKTYIDTPVNSDDLKKALRAFKWLDERGCIAPPEGVRYADLLEDDRAYQKSFEIVGRFMDQDALSPEQKAKAKMIAVRTALRLEKRDVAIQLALQIPREKVSGLVGAFLVEHYAGLADYQNAMEIGRIVLARSPGPDIRRRLSKVAAKNQQLAELQKRIDNMMSDESFMLNDVELARFGRRRHLRSEEEELPPGEITSQ